MTCVAEVVAGGINPAYKIDVFRLFDSNDLFSYVVTVAEILFLVATFYYTANSITVLKKVGFSQ